MISNMYSQYSNANHFHNPNPKGALYNNVVNNTDSGVSGSAAVVISQKTWNGTEWVPTNVSEESQSAAVPPPPSLDLPPAPPHMTELDRKTATASQLVTQYSHFYQYWSSQALEQRKTAAPGDEEANRRAVWAEYYADRSSRAAHHYNSIKQQESKEEKQEEKAVTPLQAATPQKARKSRWGVKQQQQIQPPPSEEESPPDSLQRFAHANLRECKTAADKEAMQKQLEIIIRNAIQDGSMHTKNWDLEPKIQLQKSYEQPSSKTYSSKRPHNNSDLESNQNSNSFPLVDTSPRKNPTKKKKLNLAVPYSQNKSLQQKFDKYDENLPSNDSYYGNHSTSVTNDSEVYPDPAPDFIPFSASSPARSKNASKKMKKKPHKQYIRSSSNDGFEHSHKVLSQRANRFKGKGGINSASSSIHDEYSSGVEKYMGKSVIGGSKKQLNESDYEKMTVKGTCQVLEKDYLRLTAPPRAELVRPQNILEEHLTNLKTKYNNGKQTNGKVTKNKKNDTYNWFCSQFKALRQDLTVQRIFNAFTVDVYETHARVALEQGDLNEFNQCQTQLKDLYELLSNNIQNDKISGLQNQNEFIAYRLIYHVFLTGNEKYDGGSSDLFKIMLDLTRDQRSDPCISHALKVRSAFAEFDYHTFFCLKDSCPNIGNTLMEYMVPQVRNFAMNRILKAYRPTIPLSFVLAELHLNSDGSGTEWLKSVGVVFSEDGKHIQCKQSIIRESKVQNSLI